MRPPSSWRRSRLQYVAGSVDRAARHAVATIGSRHDVGRDVFVGAAAAARICHAVGARRFAAAVVTARRHARVTGRRRDVALRRRSSEVHRDRRMSLGLPLGSCRVIRTNHSAASLSGEQRRAGHGRQDNAKTPIHGVRRVHCSCPTDRARSEAQSNSSEVMDLRGSADPSSDSVRSCCAHETVWRPSPELYGKVRCLLRCGCGRPRGGSRQRATGGGLSLHQRSWFALEHDASTSLARLGP